MPSMPSLLGAQGNVCSRFRPVLYCAICRVQPAKFVAKLRKLRPVDSKKMLLLKTDMGAGHFSVTGRFERLKEVS